MQTTHDLALGRSKGGLENSVGEATALPLELCLVESQGSSDNYIFESEDCTSLLERQASPGEFFRLRLPCRPCPLNSW